MRNYGIIAIDYSRVCIEDLFVERPNAIVRCDGNPNDLIKVIPERTNYRPLYSKIMRSKKPEFRQI